MPVGRAKQANHAVRAPRANRCAPLAERPDEMTANDPKWTLGPMLRLVAALIVTSVLISPGALRAEADRVAIKELVGNPDRYHAKVVRVRGFVTIRFENNSLCAVPKPTSKKDCLWLQFDDGRLETNADIDRYERAKAKWQPLSGSSVELRGTFNKTSHGHQDLWPGAIERVTDIRPADKE